MTASWGRATLHRNRRDPRGMGESRADYTVRSPGNHRPGAARCERLSPPTPIALQLCRIARFRRLASGSVASCLRLSLASIRRALVLACALTSTACFQMTTVLKVNGDGSGTIDHRMVYTKAALARLVLSPSA